MLAEPRQSCKCQNEDQKLCNTIFIKSVHYNSFHNSPDHFNKNIEMDFIVEVHFRIFSQFPAPGPSLSRDTHHIGIGVKDPLNVDRDISACLLAPGNHVTSQHEKHLSFNKR